MGFDSCGCFGGYIVFCGCSDVCKKVSGTQWLLLFSWNNKEGFAILVPFTSIKCVLGPRACYHYLNTSECGAVHVFGWPLWHSVTGMYVSK